MVDSNRLPSLAGRVRDFVLEGFTPRFGQREGTFPTHPVWKRMRELGSELWLDTGSLEESGELWTAEFTALTTNNTLLNREVQRGTYDELIPEAAALLADCGDLSERERILEIAFILNARHGLKLVSEYDARVSVEEHTDLAGDVEAAVACGRRYHAICPERFIVKVPLTPAGLLATRRLAAEGIAVNHTLGFSARQNYIAARIAGPAYVNVFAGRLNSVVADNALGDGTLVGEKATLASQAAVRALRAEAGSPTRQIGASIRSGQQVRDLAGVDVLTIPPKAAAGLLELGVGPEELTDRTCLQVSPGIDADADVEAVGLDTLWDVGDSIVACCDALDGEDVDTFTPDDLVAFFADRGCGGALVGWSDDQVAASTAEGKIPRLDAWRDELAGGRVGLDSLMNLAGLCSFRQDQKAMDDRVAGLLRC